MPLNNAENLLRALLSAKQSIEIRKILEEIGDFGNAELDQPFGRFQFCWHAFGNVTVHRS